MDDVTFGILLVTVAGQTFGIPAEQVDSLHVYTPAPAGNPEMETSDKPAALSEALGYATTSTSGHAVRTHGRAFWQVEAVGDLVSLPWGSLRRLPGLLAQKAMPAVWGAAVHDEEILLLLDLERLGAKAPEGDLPCGD